MNRKAEARAKAKAMREEAVRAQRRRDRILRFGIAGAVVVIVVAIAVAVQLGRDDGEGPVVLPEAANQAGDGIVVGAADAPVRVELWIDFQCPVCRAFEDANGDVIEELLDNGTIQVVYHPAAFIGVESERAAGAFGCAADAGEPQAFLRELFAHQPPERSGGFTEDDLLAHGESVGLTGAEFQGCVSDGTFAGWGGHVTDAMGEAGIAGTPAVFIDGDELVNAPNVSPDALRAAVDEALAAAGN